MNIPEPSCTCEAHALDLALPVGSGPPSLSLVSYQVAVQARCSHALSDACSQGEAWGIGGTGLAPGDMRCTRRTTLCDGLKLCPSQPPLSDWQCSRLILVRTRAKEEAAALLLKEHKPRALK